MPQREIQLPTLLLTILGLLAAAVVMTYAALRMHNPFLLGMIWVVPLLFLLPNRLDWWLILIMWLYASNVRLPGLFAKLELVHIAAAGFVGVIFARHIIMKRGAKREGLAWYFIYLFAATVVVVIAMRGTGFRFLGDSKWGGMAYVTLMISIAFTFAVGYVRLTPRQWKLGFIGLYAASMLPFLADAVFLLSQGEIYHQYYLFQVGVTSDAYTGALEGSMTRYSTGSAFGFALAVLPCLMFHFRGRELPKYLLFWIAAFFFGALSGHRLAILKIGTFIWLYCFVMMKGRRMMFLGVSGLVTAVLFIFLVGFAQYFPDSIQRSISFIPLLDVDPLVKWSADGTVDWRMRLWKRAVLEELPLYWILGKGFAYDGELEYMLRFSMDNVEWAIAKCLYHNGPLSLMIGLGAIGFFAGIALLISASWRHVRIANMPWNNATLDGLHEVFTIIFVVEIVSFFAIFGHVPSSFPSFLMQFALLEALVVADRGLRDQAVSQPLEERSTESPPRAVLPRVSRQPVMR